MTVHIYQQTIRVLTMLANNWHQPNSTDSQQPVRIYLSGWPTSTTGVAKASFSLLYVGWHNSYSTLTNYFLCLTICYGYKRFNYMVNNLPVIREHTLVHCQRMPYGIWEEYQAYRLMHVENFLVMHMVHLTQKLVKMFIKKQYSWSWYSETSKHILS